MIGQYFTPLVHSLKNNQTWIMENALSALNSFAITENAFGPHLPSLIILIYEVINRHAGQEYHKQTVGQSIELLGTILQYQKK